jgi:hypothetical protein
MDMVRGVSYGTKVPYLVVVVRICTVSSGSVTDRTNGETLTRCWTLDVGRSL